MSREKVTKELSRDSPVHRKSLQIRKVAQNRRDVDPNDDDAERAALIAEDKSKATNSPKVSTPVRYPSGDVTSSPQKEHFQGCLKLFAENKINKENAWNLQLIDFMSTMIRKHDKRMENLQMASTTLDASARIYSFRVDAVHYDVLSIAGGLAKAANSKRGKKDDDQQEDGQDHQDGQDNPAGPAVKKKKKARGSIATSEDQLNGDFEAHECIDPFFTRLAATSGDMTSSNRSFNATLPIEDSSLSLKLRTDQPFLPPILEDETEDLDIDKVEKTSCFFLEYKNDDEICAPFSGFCITNWNPDDEKDDLEKGDINGWMDERLNLSQQAVAFDMHAEVEPIPNDDNDLGIDDEMPLGLDSDEEGDMVLNICAAKRTMQGVVQLTDSRPTRSTDMHLEYSYSSALLYAWAGPSHWKLKNNVNRASKSTHQNMLGLSARSASVEIRKAKVVAPRKKKQLDFLGEHLSFHRSSIPAEYAPALPSKLCISRRTLVLSDTWNDKNFITPIDKGIEDLHFRRFYLKKNVLMMLPRKSDIGIAEDKQQDLSDIRDYDYNNENDQSYCPNPDNGNPWLPDDDGALAGSVHDNMNLDEGMAEMIEPPNKVAKLYVPYQKRAKPIDMKQLRESAWKCLSSMESEKENEPSSSNNNDKTPPPAQYSFNALYKLLPQKLSSSMRESLSIPLAVLAILHLGNDKGVQLVKHPGNLDFTIIPPTK